MSNDKREPVSSELLKKAQDLYMAYEPVTSIAKDLAVPRSTLNYWISKQWREQRQLAGSKALETISSLHSSTIQQITKDLIITASRAAADAKNSNELTLEDAERAMKIINNMQGISDRLKIEEEKNQIKSAVAYVDPFAKGSES